jgi:hypothetical protein
MPEINIRLPLLLTVLFFACTCHAQMINNNMYGGTVAPRTNTPLPTKAISPAEYQEMMQNMQKKNEPPPTPPVSVPTTVITQPAAPAATETTTTTQVVTPPPAQPVAAPETPASTLNLQDHPAPAQKQQQEAQPYTGYVAPDNNRNNNTNSPNQSSGWNIKY